jgi:hypothetical protein
MVSRQEIRPMRKLLLLFSALVMACGSDSDDGGGGLSGAVGGRPFSPLEARAIPAGTGTTPCPLPLGGATVDVGVKALAIEVTSYADACGDFATSQCRLHQNAQTVTILFARLNAVPPAAEPTLQPGTYTVYASAATAIPDGDNPGLLTVAFAQALATDANCIGMPSPSVQGGMLRLDQVTGPVTGHVSLTFQDGSSLAGDFSAPLCPGASPDVCRLATEQALCTPPLACVP